MTEASKLLERHVTLRDGAKVLIRPLRVEDAALYPDFLAEVTGEDLRLRFFAPMREVSHELIDKLIHYDPAYAKSTVKHYALYTSALITRVNGPDGAEMRLLAQTLLSGEHPKIK